MPSFRQKFIPSSGPRGQIALRAICRSALGLALSALWGLEPCPLALSEGPLEGLNFCLKITTIFAVGSVWKVELRRVALGKGIFSARSISLFEDGKYYFTQ